MNTKNTLELIKKIVKEYGFRSHVYQKSISIMARNTDGHFTQWFTLFPETSTIEGYNTDEANIWLHDTRPDLTPELLVEMFSKLEAVLAAIDETSMLRIFVDPEDWQELAGVDDAYKDARYTGKEKN